MPQTTAIWLPDGGLVRPEGQPLMPQAPAWPASMPCEQRSSVQSRVANSSELAPDPPPQPPVKSSFVWPLRSAPSQSVSSARERKTSRAPVYGTLNPSPPAKAYTSSQSPPGALGRAESSRSRVKQTGSARTDPVPKKGAEPSASSSS